MNIITKLNIRQKVMLGLTILAAVFLTWQIYTFVHDSSAQNHPVKVVGTTSPVAVAPAPVSAPNPAVTQAPPVVQTLPVISENSVLTTRQQEYLTLVRELQITKMKRQILEEQAGLATAQKRIADAGKNSNLSSISLGSDSTWSSSAQSDYELAYLDRQAGQWTATINKGNEFTEVHVGSTLGDGSKVIAIDSRGVVIQPIQGKNISLSFQDSVNLDNTNTYGNSSDNIGSTIKKAAGVNSNVANKPSTAEIAKILGITAAPVKPVVEPSSPNTNLNSSQTNPVPNAIPQTHPPGSVNSSNVGSSNNVTAIPAPVLKPVSVQELKKHQFQQIAENKEPILTQ